MIPAFVTIAEAGFVPEPVIVGRTVVVAYDQNFLEKDYRRRLGISYDSVGLTHDGLAVTFGSEREAALFKMFYEGELA